MKNLILVFTLIFSQAIFASAGEILFTKGEVSVSSKKSSKKMRVKKGHVLSLGDMVHTRDKAIAIIKLNSGSKIKLNGKSAVSLEKLLSKNSPDEVSLKRGSAFVNVLKSKLTKKSPVKFRLKTRNTAMGVRGTEFFASFGKKTDNKRKDLWMCVRTGLVEVSASASKKKVLVKAGEGVKVEEEKKVSDPKPLAWTKELNWNMEADKGEVENKVSIEEAYTDLLDKEYD